MNFMLPEHLQGLIRGFEESEQSVRQILQVPLSRSLGMLSSGSSESCVLSDSSWSKVAFKVVTLKQILPSFIVSPSLRMKPGPSFVRIVRATCQIASDSEDMKYSGPSTAILHKILLGSQGKGLGDGWIGLMSVPSLQRRLEDVSCNCFLCTFLDS